MQRGNYGAMEEILADYPTLRQTLGPRWIQKNLADPPWKSLIHPVMVMLWPSPRTAMLQAIEDALAILAKAAVPHKDIRDKLRHIDNYRSPLPELFFTAYLIQCDLHVELPTLKQGERTPDIRIRHGAEQLDLEIKALLPNISMQRLKSILHVLMESQPYSIEMQIPDDLIFKPEDILRVCGRIARFMRRAPFEGGKAEGRERFCIGRTRKCLWLVSPSNGINVTILSYFSATDATIRAAVWRINAHLKQEAPQQLANGGAVVLDISDTSGALRMVAEDRLGKDDVREQIWEGVPGNVFGVWIYHIRGGQIEPGFLRYIANPHCTTPIPALIEMLRTGPLADRDHTPSPEDEWADLLRPDMPDESAN